jgi:hypothetical protein
MAETVIDSRFIRSLAEGMLSYRIYLSKCDVSQSISEYVFYEPILRMISRRKDYISKCEFPLPRHSNHRGDFRRVDFVIGKYEKLKKKSKYIIHTGIEIKFYKSNNTIPSISNIKKDLRKLQELKEMSFSSNYNGWLFIIHNSRKKFSKLLSDNGIHSDPVSLGCVNATYHVETISLRKNRMILKTINEG